MQIEQTPLSGVVVLRPRVFGDERGFFLESWNANTFAELGINAPFVQDNHSRSKQGILRGMHYQTEQTQGKLVRVTQGRVFDAVVDMRADSPTLGEWFGCMLTADGHEMMWVSPGFAHGFYVVSESADFLYKCTDYYHPASEVSLAWNDAEVGIEWPIVEGCEPELSTKDAAGLAFAQAPRLRA